MTQLELDYLQERLAAMENILKEVQDHLFDIAEKTGHREFVVELPEPETSEKKLDWGILIPEQGK